MTLCLPWQADFPISVVSSSTSVFLSTEYIKYSKNSTTASKKEACPSEEIGFQTWGGRCDWNKGALVLVRRYKNNSATATRVLFQSTCKKIHNQLYNIRRDIPQTCIQLEGRLLMLKFIKKWCYVSVRNSGVQAYRTNQAYPVWTMRDNKALPEKSADCPSPTCHSKQQNKLPLWQQRFGWLDFRNSPDIILSEAPSLVNTLSIGVSLQTSAGT